MIRKLTALLLILCLIAGMGAAALAESFTVYVKAANVSIYKSPSASSAKMGTMSLGERMTCAAYEGDWAQVKNAAGAVGYCKISGLATKNPNTLNKKAYVKTADVPIYRRPDKSSAVLMRLKKNAVYTAVAITPDGKWARLKNGSCYGFVECKHLSTEPVSSAKESSLSRISTLARKLLGVPYVFASQSPATGLDCSGFTYYVFKNAAGISLKRSARTQGYDGRYKKISSRSDLRAGDLVFFNTIANDDDLCDHVGIYLGNNKFIHASSAKGEVTISSMGYSWSSYYYRVYSWGRRVLP